VNFDVVEKIAAAILYEGYILYPYRPSAIKNRQRWNFGTLYPRAYAQAQRPAEPFRLVAECLAVPGEKASLQVRVSFLQLVRQTPSPKRTDAENLHQPADPSLAWEEAVERRWQQFDIRLTDLMVAPLTLNLPLDATGLADARGAGLDPELRAEFSLKAEKLPERACRLSLELLNGSALARDVPATRAEALARSFVSAHVLLGISDGEFVSLLDPGEEFREAAAACRNVGVFPVLAGKEPDRTAILCSPIILYDYPKIAPESAGDFFDGTEMDEMLALRVLTLTDAEKAEVRAGDARGRRILERTEALTNDSLLKAHGAIRGMREIRGDAR
jgi:hypothetical protein